MGNTPTGCADDLPTSLAIFKNDPKSKRVINVFSGWILPQTVYKKKITSQSSAEARAPRVNSDSYNRG